MAQVLPKGLVSNTDRIRTELRDTDRVDVEDIAKLWKVYTTNKTTLKEDAGRRFENLFWRIWSNKQIRSSIQGSTLAKLFVHISDRASISAEGIGKTKHNAENGLVNVSAGHPSKDSTPKSSSPPPSKSHGSSVGSYRPANRSSSGARTPLPPSILKKPRQPSEAYSVSSKGFSVDPQNKSLNAPSSLSGSYQSHSGRRKKTTFAANLTSSQEEADDAFPTRSRSGSGNNQGIYTNIRSTSKLSPFSQPATDRSIPEVSGNPTTPDPTTSLFVPNFTLTSHNKLPPPPRSNPYANQSQPSPMESRSPFHRPSPALNSPPPAQSQSQLDSTHLQHQHQQQRQPSAASLVDKNFRTRFAEKKLAESRVSSLSNLIVEREPDSNDDQDVDRDDSEDEYDTNPAAPAGGKRSAYSPSSTLPSHSEPTRGRKR